MDFFSKGFWAGAFSVWLLSKFFNIPIIALLIVFFVNVTYDYLAKRMKK